MDIRTISKLGRDLIVDLTEQPFDAIARCEARDGGWRLEIEVIESRARMGDDDLLTAYALDLSADGELLGYRRLGRRRRFDDTSSAA